MLNNKKPLVYVIGARSYGGEGGIENQVKLLYPLLSSKYDVIIGIDKRNLKKDLLKNEKVKLTGFLVPKNKFINKILLSYFSTIDAIKKKPEIVHYNGMGSCLFLPLIRIFSPKTKIITHIRSYDIVYLEWNILAKMVFIIINYFIKKFSHIIIVVNPLFQRLYKDSIYIPNPVKIDTSLKDEKVLGVLNLEKKKYILTVGRIIRSKRFDILIKAFYKSKLKKGYKLVIVGKFQDKKYLRELREISDRRVIFTGTLDKGKIYALYKYSYAFVLPSRYEGMPNVVLEACWFNIPVFVSSIVQHLILEFLEKCAYFNNIDELKEKLENPKICYSKEKLKHLHDPENIIKEIDKIYQKLLNRN